METTQGISLYKLSSSQTSKNAMAFFLFYAFFLQQNQNKRVEQVLPGSGGGWGTREKVAYIMYMQVSNYKNDKIKISKTAPLLNLCRLFSYLFFK
jgi:hypothetical protein